MGEADRGGSGGREDIVVGVKDELMAFTFLVK